MDMLMNTGILRNILEHGKSYVLENLGTAMGQISTGALLGILLVGTLNCFLGYRLMKLWLFLVGAAAGAAAGFFLGLQFTESPALAAVIAAAAALVCGGLSYWIYQAGVFLFCFVGGTLAFSFLFRPGTSLFFFLCMLLGAALGVAGVKFVRPVVILQTSVSGGMMMGSAVIGYLQKDSLAAAAALGGLLAAAGFLVQWFVTGKKRRRPEETEDTEAENEDED